MPVEIAKHMAIATFNGIPVYDAVLSGDDTGMLRISLVDEPAVMSDFLAFEKEKEVLTFSVQDEEKRIVRGVVMRADFPIYRESSTLGQYYIIYKPDTIRAMAEKYLADNRQNLVNLMHEAGTDVDGVQMVQWFIKDTAAGMNPEGFDGIRDGSLFAEFHVLNDDVWARVKDGTFRGFSLEGVFDLMPEQKLTKQTNKMSKMQRIKDALRRMLEQFAEINTDKGVLAWDGDEDLKAGDAVYTVAEDGSRSAAGDGDYITEDGKTIRVSGGRVESITDPDAEVEDVAEEMGEASTDNGILYYEGDEDLKAGDEVYILDEEANRKPAPDGEYRTEDGKTIVVADGRVAEIRDPEAEVAPEEDAAEEFDKTVARFEESYDERMRRIRDAVAEKLDGEFYIVDAGDDFAVACTWEEGSDKFWRFPIAWNEDGTAYAGEGVEVKPMFVPMDFVSPFDPKAGEELRALKAEVAKLRRKVAAKPAHETVQMHDGTAETGIKGLDRLARLVRKK